jgi:hypothetical protein
MKQETVSVLPWASGRLKQFGVVISLRRSSTEDCDAILGYPGLPNVAQTMRNGDAVLLETTHDGIIEVRAMAIYSSRVEFLVSQVSPRPGFAAGAFDADPNNAPFDESELRKIAQSIATSKQELARTSTLLPEQLGLVSRKLDEIQAAASRLGRKDWINYVAGALTSTCISAAFAPEVTKNIFAVLNAAFSWLFTSAALLLHRM